MLTPIDEFIQQQLDPVQIWRNYFNAVPAYRGHYFGEMKRQVAQKLRDNGMSLEKIGEVVNLNHSSVIQRLRSRPDIKVRVTVEDNLNKWIKEGLYPKSKNVNTTIPFNGAKESFYGSSTHYSYTTYELVDKSVIK